MDRVGDAESDSSRRWPGALGLGLVLALVVAVPMATVLWLTSSEIGATPDGAVYLGVASNLSEGRGVTSPVSSVVDSIPPDDAIALYGRTPLLRWPPGFPLVLAAASKVLGLEPSAAARVVAVAAIGCNAALTFLIGRRWTGSALVGAACALLVVTEPYHLVLHSVVSSEPLFLTATLACVLAAEHWVKEQSVGVLALAAGAAGTAALIRFSGFAVLFAVAVTVLALAHHRVRDLAIVCFAALPALAWMGVTEGSPYREAHRRIRPLPWSEIETMFDTVRGWIVTGSSSSATRLIVCLALLAATIAGTVSLGRRALLPATVVIAHTTIVVASAVLIRQLPVGGRMLMPLQPLVVCLAATGVVGSIRWASAHIELRWSDAVPRTAVVLFAVAIGSVAVRHEAVAIASLEPATQPPELDHLLLHLDKLPSGTAIFSNDAASYYLMSRRPAVSVPSRRWQESGVSNRGYDDELQRLIELVAEGRAAVVIYPSAAFFNSALARADEISDPRIDQIDVDGVILITSSDDEA